MKEFDIAVINVIMNQTKCNYKSNYEVQHKVPHSCDQCKYKSNYKVELKIHINSKHKGICYNKWEK